MRWFYKIVFGFVAAFALLTSSDVSAQDFPSEIWHPGKLVLLSGDTIPGQIKYDFENDIVQVNQGNRVRTFGARKILYFEILDQTVDSYRFFYALPFNVHSNYEVPILFEVLYEGKLSLLSREHIVTESQPQYAYNYGYVPGMNTSRTRLAYAYFFLEQDGAIEQYNLKKKELLDFFGNRSKQVKQYMKKNNLKYDRMHDLVRITAYYNALIE